MAENRSRKPAGQLLYEIKPWHKAFASTVRDLWNRTPVVPTLPPRTPGTPIYRMPKLSYEVAPWRVVFTEQLRELIRREKQAPLHTTSKPVAVPEIWNWKAYKEQFFRTELVSLLAHMVVVLLIAIPFTSQETQAESKKELQVVEVSDVSEYKITLPPATQKSGGGGGGGERNPIPASKGRLPKFSLEAQLTPPAAVIRNENPKLVAEPTVVVPPNLYIENPDINAYGDPLASNRIPSGGPGSGGGIGTGSGGGVGSGQGPGVGPGWGGGYGGGVFRVGGNVSAPICLYCPKPEYSEEARKAKYQGMVVLWAVINEQGRIVPESIRVAQSIGMGLDEEAVRAVQNWRFKPAQRGGKPVPVYTAIEVSFNLL